MGFLDCKFRWQRELYTWTLTIAPASSSRHITDKQSYNPSILNNDLFWISAPSASKAVKTAPTARNIHPFNGKERQKWCQQYKIKYSKQNSKCKRCLEKLSYFSVQHVAFKKLHILHKHETSVSILVCKNVHNHMLNSHTNSTCDMQQTNNRIIGDFAIWRFSKWRLCHPGFVGHLLRVSMMRTWWTLLSFCKICVECLFSSFDNVK